MQLTNKYKLSLETITIAGSNGTSFGATGISLEKYLSAANEQGFLTALESELLMVEPRITGLYYAGVHRYSLNSGEFASSHVTRGVSLTFEKYFSLDRPRELTIVETVDVC